MFRVLHPEFLLLLLLIPLLWWSARRVRVLGRGRKTLALVLRTAVLIFFILVLAEVEKVDPKDALAVFFVLDRSSSIPAEEQQFSLAYVQEQTSAIPLGDRAGIVFFGKDAAIQENPREDVKLNQYRTLIDPEGTNIESALGLAMAAFPEGVQKRIVLLTDGNQTEGSAEQAVQRALAGGVDVRLLPLQYTHTQDVLVEEVGVPGQIREQEPFAVRVRVNALESGPATVRVTENGQIIAEQNVDLQPGKNVFLFNRTLNQTGVYTYEAGVEAQNDRRPANNRAQNFAVVRGVPKVLLLESEPEEGKNLAAALLSQGIQVEMRGPNGLPIALRELQAFDSVILSNVSASEVSDPQMRMLESAVRDLGIGLVMIGGPESFGAGGYGGTPIEEALPVSMDITQKRVLPSGALVMIMHSCEIPQGNYWAQQISLSALDVLSRNDYVGFLYYNGGGPNGGEQWLFPLEQAGNKRRQRNLLMSMQYAAIGDMPSFDSTLEMAYQSLRLVRTNVKHIIILSDGDPGQPTPTLLQKILDEKITISTVCISPHNQRDAAVMKDLADTSKGKFYFVQDYTQLPRIFIKEASVVRRNVISEQPFTPAVAGFSEVIQGFEAGFPPLDGYVVTTAKPQAETVLVGKESDPVLAHGRHGLGKTLAFASDAKSRWAKNWLAWEGYAKFWGQAIRWTLPNNRNEQFQVESRLDGERIYVKVDAVTDDGQFLNQLKFQSAFIDPQFRSQPFDLRQTGPGLYEGSFPAGAPGNYMATMTFTGEGAEGNVTAGVSIPYSPEHNSTRQNDVFLARLKDLTGHEFLDVKSSVFAHDLERARSMQPLWPLLLALVIVLFFLDIAVRRVFFELTQLQNALNRVWLWLVFPFRRRLAPAGPATEPIGQLMQAKQRAMEPGTASSGLSKEELMRRLDEANVSASETPDPVRSAPDPGDWRELRPQDEPQKFTDEPSSAYTQALFRAKDRAKKNLDNQTGKVEE